MNAFMRPKTPRRISTYRGNGKTTCRICETRLNKNSLYSECCSKQCATDLADFNSILFPARFVMNLLIRTSNEFEIRDAVFQYAKRHRFDIEKTNIKFNILRQEYAKKGLDALIVRKNS